MRTVNLGTRQTVRGNMMFGEENEEGEYERRDLIEEEQQRVEKRMR